MKVFFKVALIFFISTIYFSCNNSKPSKTVTKSGEIHLVTPQEFKDNLKNQTLIDIRTPREFEQGHIEGAININMYDRDFIENISKYNTSDPIFIYCRSGSRTTSASKKMSKAGFTKIYHLHGGIVNWYKNKLKIVK